MSATVHIELPRETDVVALGEFAARHGLVATRAQTGLDLPEPAGDVWLVLNGWLAEAGSQLVPSRTGELEFTLRPPAG